MAIKINPPGRREKNHVSTLSFPPPIATAGSGVYSRYGWTRKREREIRSPRDTLNGWPIDVQNKARFESDVFQCFSLASPTFLNATFPWSDFFFSFFSRSAKDFKRRWERDLILPVYHPTPPLWFTTFKWTIMLFDFGAPARAFYFRLQHFNVPSYFCACQP